MHAAAVGVWCAMYERERRLIKGLARIAPLHARLVFYENKGY